MPGYPLGDPLVLNPHISRLADRFLDRLALRPTASVLRLHRAAEGSL